MTTLSCGATGMSSIPIKEQFGLLARAELRFNAREGMSSIPMVTQKCVTWRA